MYTFLDIHKVATSSFHLCGIDGVELDDQQWPQCSQYLATRNRNLQLPHVKFAFRNPVRAATHLVPNEVDMGSLTISDLSYGARRLSFERIQCFFCDLARERQECAYERVREQNTPLPPPAFAWRGSALTTAPLKSPSYNAED